MIYRRCPGRDTIRPGQRYRFVMFDSLAPYAV